MAVSWHGFLWISGSGENGNTSVHASLRNGARECFVSITKQLVPVKRVCQGSCCASTFSFAWKERLQGQASDAMKCPWFLRESVGSRVFAGRFAVSPSQFPLMTPAPRIIENCLFVSQKKKKGLLQN